MDNDYLYSYKTNVKTNNAHGNLNTDSSYSCAFYYEPGEKEPLHDFYIKVFGSLEIKGNTRYIEIDSKKINFEDVNDKFAQNFMKSYLSKKYPSDLYEIYTKPVELDKFASENFAGFMSCEKHNREIDKKETLEKLKKENQLLKESLKTTQDALKDTQKALKETTVALKALTKSFKPYLSLIRPIHAKLRNALLNEFIKAADKVREYQKRNFPEYEKEMANKNLKQPEKAEKKEHSIDR